MHRRIRTHKYRTIIATLLSLAALLFAVAPWQAGASETPGGHALDWAEANAYGHPYQWGGTGPYGYDCSGLVMEAAGHADGIWLPRTAYSMTHNWHLYQVWSPQRGDIVAWGYPWTYHVGFVTIWSGYAFGAEQSGTRIGWYYDNWGWRTYWRLR
jgi:hypothetical protein